MTQHSKNHQWLTSDFDFVLPPERIAQTPAEPRDSSRLLHVRGGGFDDHHMSDLPNLLRPGDLLVMNDTKVIPARLYGKRGTVTVEILLHRKQGPQTWLAFARPGKRLRVGDQVVFAPDFSAEILEKKDGGEVLLHFTKNASFRGARSANPESMEQPHHGSMDSGSSLPPTPEVLADKIPRPAVALAKAGRDVRNDENIILDEELFFLLQKYGEPPLPPYIRRDPGEAKQDVAQYQTIYAKREGAVAAPTAGLHFTPELFQRLEEKGIKRCTVTLHVGAGTFLPVKVEKVSDHVMHAEWGEITAETAMAINKARQEGRRVVAVGTTSLRLLESAADDKGVIRPFAGETDIFITPGYRFRAIDVLLTNFHLPKSTLFMLACAFGGFEPMKAAYAHAIAKGYRFYSYGDATLLEKP